MKHLKCRRFRFSVAILWSIAMVFGINVNGVRVSASTIRYVNQATGPYTSVTAAVNASSSGDIIEITDSQNYYENFIIGPNGKNISSVTIRGKEGEQPVISGEGITGTVIRIENDNCRIENLTVYVGGALYGIDCLGSNTEIDRVSFDNHIAASGYTFCVNLNKSTTITNCSFLGSQSNSSGGILANTDVPINLTVYRCDFYGTGTVGGMVGLGMAPGSTATITQCCFSTENTSSTIIGINNWRNGTIVENTNTFRNINNPVVGFNNNIYNTNDVVSSGSIYPTNSGVQMTDTILSSLISWLGATNEYSWSYPTASMLSSSLNKGIRSEHFDWFDPNYYDTVLNTTLKQNTLQYFSYTGAKMWFDFSISWSRQFDPYVWNTIKKAAAEVKSQPDLSNIVLQGYCMESIKDTSINDTPMDRDLWLFVARNFPDISFRPLVAKFVNGRRWQGHWFDYSKMLGYGVNHWAAGESVPNLNKQEALLYYIYLAKSFIDAGMNDVSFAQPQLTFGQNLFQNGYGGANLRLVSRFARNYGHYFASPINGQRYVTCGLSTCNTYIKSYANYINYTRGPAGVTDYRGFGASWSTINDAWNTIPPSNIVITGKPHICEIDNGGVTEDQISAFAKTVPATRNSFMISFTDYLLQNRGFYIMQPGLEPLTPTGCQNFTGYLTPPQGSSHNYQWPWAWFFQPFDEYSGFESTVKSIFDSH